MKRDIGDLLYSQEIECEFLGSSNTLFSGPYLKSLKPMTPKKLIENSDSLVSWEDPKPNCPYIMTVDVSRGVGLDYSTFLIIDISEIPYKVVCRYRDNKISTLAYPSLIMQFANLYNDAFVLIETNDLGQQVADILMYDLEYENIYMSEKTDNNKANKKISEAGAKKIPGIRTTKRTKTIGCDRLKVLCEERKLVFYDDEIIKESYVFIRKGTSFAADAQKHDDLMMCLVIFGFLTSQDVFLDLFDFSLREKLIEAQIREMESRIAPIPILPTNNKIIEVEKTDNLVWVVGDDYNDYVTNCWNTI